MRLELHLLIIWTNLTDWWTVSTTKTTTCKNNSAPREPEEQAKIKIKWDIKLTT